MQQVNIWCAAVSKERTGVWGAVLEWRGKRKKLVGVYKQTSQRRSELTAVIKGFAALKRPCKVNVRTMSEYVVQGVRRIQCWHKNGWLTKELQPVANQGLWQLLWEQLLKGHDAQFILVSASEACDWPVSGEELMRYLEDKETMNSVRICLKHNNKEELHEQTP